MLLGGHTNEQRDNVLTLWPWTCLKGCSEDAIATAIYSSKIMGCMGLGVIVTITL